MRTRGSLFQSHTLALLLSSGALFVVGAGPARAQHEAPAAADPHAAPAAAAPADPHAAPAAEAPAAADPHAAPAAADPHAAAAADVAQRVEAAGHAAGAAHAGEHERPPTGSMHKEAGGGHGGGHDAPVIENWWSWDYGPGKTHHHPPFGFALINFVVFLLILRRLIGPSFREMLASRHGDVRKALDRAQTLEKKAQEQLAEYERRTQAVESEVQELLTSLRKQAEAERQRIIAQAETEADKLLKDAESQVRVAVEGARRDLMRKAGQLAVELAESLIRQKITDTDQRGLAERYVAQVESAAKPGSHGPAQGSL
jgi:F-type H+-transporting ATPase subunit b